MAAPNTPMARQSRSVSSRNGTEIAVKMMIPPIVGVPALEWCSGPSSRMNWPNSRSRRNAMNLGERKMQMSREAVPAIRTSPTGRRLRADQRLGHGLEPDPSRRLDQHDVAGLDDLARGGRGRGRIGRQDGLAGERAGRLGGQRADGEEHVDAGGGGVRADL